MSIDTNRTDQPTCPACGYVHEDAWEWNFGPGLDGSGSHDCDECGAPFKVERIVDVCYTTTAVTVDGVKP